MSGLVNKVKEALHSDKDKTTTHNTHGTTATTTGSSGNNLAAAREGPAPTTAGPHKSDALNKADPRVDSDKDYSRNMGMNPSRSAETGTHTSHTGTSGLAGTHTGAHTGSTGLGGSNYSENVPEGTYGHHNSRLANAADPRIDSDLDGSRARGTGTHSGAGLGSSGHTTGAVGHGSSGLTGSSGLHGSGNPEGTYGTHNSRVANAADPRIDSDLDGSRTVGNTQTHNTYSGSGLGGAANTTGRAPNTAGPHNSDFMNKADPRVDSDLDGSKTLGQDKTFQQS